MSTKNLDNFFNPESVAVIGATDREDSISRTLTENLMKNYEAEVYPVNTNRDKVFGVETLPSVKNIPEKVDLGCIITPARTVPGIVKECGEVGIPALIIVSAGFRESGSEGKKLESEIERLREQHDIRILGPNSLGIIRPSRGLNATISEKFPDPGRIAFISQSGALGPSIIGRQEGSGIGFSAFVSVGNMIDVDFGDLIDYFGKDHKTRTILMHVESINKPKKFLSAAKSFSRTRPIILEKSGRYEESSKSVSSHIGSIPGKDALYDALFRRTGVVRVDSINDLFSCSEALAHECLPKGPNLAVITNAGGPGIMAVDALTKYGGRLATISDETKNRLEEILPRYASKSNPIDISSDASVARYIDCTEACFQDDKVDGILVIYTPHGVFSPEDLAEELVDLSQKEEKPILACWLGGEARQDSRNILRRGGIPTVDAPRQGARIFMYMYRHLRNRELLYETPEPLAAHKIPVRDQVSQREYLKSMIENLNAENRNILMEDESKKFLQTYSIPAVETHIASNPEKAVELSKEIGFPVVLKVRTPDNIRKRKINGIEFDLRSESAVREAYDRILKSVKKEHPDTKIYGITVQKMIKDIKYEITLGSEKHPNFGSYVTFGRANVDGKLYQDKAVDFPPLNQINALRLMEGTKVLDLIEEMDDEPSRKVKALQEYLARLSQLVIDLPEIKKIKITMAGWDGGLSAIDAKIRLDEANIPYTGDPYEHLTIEPYPLRYIKTKNLEDGRKVTIRPIRAEDEPLVFDLFDTFSRETLVSRFFTRKRKITREDIIRFTSVDYRRAIHLVGEIMEDGESKIIGIGSILIDPKEDTGEFAVVVGDPWQGLGLGKILMDSIVKVAEDKDLESLWGEIKRDSFPMLHICEKLGFHIDETHPGSVKMTLNLNY